MRTHGIVLCTALMLVGTPAGGQAQVLTISLSGVTTATIVRADNGTRQVIDQVAAGRPFKLDLSRVNAVKGQEMNVSARTTSQGLDLIFGDNPGCGGPSQEDCDAVVVVMPGSDTRLDVSSIGGAVTLVTKRPPPKRTIGAQFGFTNFLKLRDVGCNRTAITGLTDCTADASGTSYGAYAEYGVTNFLRLGARYTRTSYAVNQQYGSRAVLHDVDVTRYDTYVSLVPYVGGPYTPFGRFGMSWLRNEGDRYDDDIFVETRDQSGWRAMGGAGLDVRLSSMLRFRTEFSWLSAGSDDADTMLDGAFSLNLNF